MAEHEGLITRILQIRRSSATARRRSSSTVEPDDGVIRALEDRVTHLEQMVQGLQDSVHREALRYGKRLAELEAQIHPAALSKSLSKDARERGL
jgi:hypothetical protein